jgi:ketosteroid isomerase-like protein
MRFHRGDAIPVVCLGIVLLSGGVNGARAQTDASGTTATRLATTDTDSSTRTDVLRARQAIWRAWFANDTARLARLLPEAVAAGTAGEPWQDRRATLEGARRFVGQGGKLLRLEFPQTEIRTSGDVAVVFSTFVLETESGGRRQTTTGRSTEVFVRRNGGWQNPFWHLGPRG